METDNIESPLPPLLKVPKTMSTTSWVLHQNRDLQNTPFRLPSRDYRSHDSKWRSGQGTEAQGQSIAAQGHGMESRQVVRQDARRQIESNQLGPDKGLHGLNNGRNRLAREAPHSLGYHITLEHNRQFYDNPGNHVTTHQTPQRNAVETSFHKSTQGAHAQHVHGIGRTIAMSHNASHFPKRYSEDLVDAVSQIRSTQSYKQTDPAQISPDLHSLPAIQQREHLEMSRDKKRHQSKSRRLLNKRALQPINTAPPGESVIKHESHSQSNKELDKPRQLKHFIKHFNKKESKSLTSNKSVSRKSDLPSIAAGSITTSVPRWFLGSVAKSEHLEVARSSDSFQDEGDDAFDPDFDDITDAQEFYESYSKKNRSGSHQDEQMKSTESPENSHKASVWRTLPMQTELEKYLHFLKSGKGLDQKFTNYVGAHIAGKYRSGGPISRPRSQHKPAVLAHKPRQAEQIKTDSKENSAHSRQPQEMNRMSTRMTTMLN